MRAIVGALFHEDVTRVNFIATWASFFEAGLSCALMTDSLYVSVALI